MTKKFSNAIIINTGDSVEIIKAMTATIIKSTNTHGHPAKTIVRLALIKGKMCVLIDSLLLIPIKEMGPSFKGAGYCMFPSRKFKNSVLLNNKTAFTINTFKHIFEAVNFNSDKLITALLEEDLKDTKKVIEYIENNSPIIQS